MTDPYAAPQPGEQPTPPPYAPPVSYGAPPVGAGQPGPIGKVRPTGKWIFFFIITLGIAGLVWYYSVHDEMKKHTGEGIDGVIALVIAVIVGIASPFLASDAIGKVYERAGRPAPVNAMTGLWVFPGMFIIVGPFIWFAKTNRALNDYWTSLGAQA